MKQSDTGALNQARLILGRRAKIYRDRGQCVVARNEMSQTGERFVKDYGRGDTWADALERAAESYREMREQHRRPA